MEGTDKIEVCNLGIWNKKLVWRNVAEIRWINYSGTGDAQLHSSPKMGFRTRSGRGFSVQEVVEFKVFGEKLVGVLRRVFWNFTNHGSSGGRAALYSEVCPRFWRPLRCGKPTTSSPVSKSHVDVVMQARAACAISQVNHDRNRAPRMMRIRAATFSWGPTVAT